MVANVATSVVEVAMLIVVTGLLSCLGSLLECCPPQPLTRVTHPYPSTQLRSLVWGRRQMASFDGAAVAENHTLNMMAGNLTSGFKTVSKRQGFRV